MRSLFITLLLFTAFTLNAATYYVATTGNNSNPGTIGSPWLTWRKAFNTAQSGDTVFFRGGIYYSTEGAAGLVVDSRYPGETYGCYSGTAGNLICFFNYPNEVPILDCRNVTPSGGGTAYGIMTRYVDYVHYKGLHLRNLWQKGTNAVIDGWSNWYDSDSLVYENCSVTSISGQGFYSAFGNSVHYINCDASYCIDSTSNTPGQYGTGFNVDNRDYTGRTVSNNSRFYFYGCRSWKCSDQGHAGRPWGYEYWEDCWSFNNGAYLGDGHGFKPSPPDDYQTVPTLQRKFVNCISAYNSYSGWATNESYTRAAARMQVYNCTSYHNGYAGKGSISGIGFWLLVTSAEGNPLTRIIRNSVAYANEQYASYSDGTTYTHSNNSWDIPITLTDADFVSVDSTGITAARQADGSLPDNDCYNYFLRPSSTFQGYQDGIDVDLTYDAVDSLWRTPPSIGFKEYYPITPATDPVLADISTYHPYWLTTTTASSGGFVADNGGGTVSVRGVCWNTTGTPTTADSKTEDGTGDGAFTSTMTGLTQGTTYYVRAYATNEAGTAYGSQMTFRTQIIKHDNKFIKHGGKFIIVN